MTELNYTKSTSVHFLGLVNYQDISVQQVRLAERIRSTQDIEILGMEFHSVITLGIRGEASDLQVEQKEIPIVRTDRGGQATLHNPGQLVIYPTMDLKAHGIGVRDFVCMLIRATSAVLKAYGIESNSVGAPGVYTSKGKIAFIGIRLDRGVVRHGISINLSNELSAFSNIRSCGVTAAMLDRVQNHTRTTLDMSSIFDKWVIGFQKELALSQRANNVYDLQSAK